MSRSIAPVVLILGLLAVGMPARAQSPLYSFDDGAQGFGPNGTHFQVMVYSDQGTGYLEFGIVSTEPFGGALTHVVNQAALLDPATKAIALDVTDFTLDHG